MSRRIQLNLTVFGLVFAFFVIWAARNIVTLDAIEGPYSLAGEFDAAAGVLPNAEVSYLGVRYGRVSAVARIPDGVHLSMKIDKGRQIPEGSVARIFRKSAVGEPYVLFVPPDAYDGGGPYLEAGAVLSREQTTVPLEFSEMLKSASRLVSAIDPEAAGTLVHELALALNGRSESLRALALAGDKLAQTFADRTEALDRLAKNNTRLTKVVAEHRASLGSALADLRAVSASLRKAHGDVDLLLDDGTEVLGRTANIVAAEKGTIDCILGDLEDVLDVATTSDRLAGLEEVLQEGPATFEGVFDTRDVEADGVWVRVGLIANPDNPALQYVPAKDLPKVPDVPVCGSELTAAPGSFEPTDFGDLAATGRTLGLAFGLALLAAALVLRFTLTQEVE